MFYLIIFILNFTLGIYLSHIEILCHRKENNKVSIMGKWPFNLILLLGIVLVLIGEQIGQEWPIFILSIIGTVICYVFEIQKIRKSNL